MLPDGVAATNGHPTPDAGAPHAAPHGLKGFAQRARAVLPQGQTLPTAAWERRHRAILWLLWAHAVVLPACALARGYGVGHRLLHGAPLGALAAHEALEMMRTERGRHFDPAALDAFLGSLDEVMAIRERYTAGAAATAAA